MEKPATDQGKRQQAHVFYRKMCLLSVGGGVVFWLTTIATSLLTLAAKYRAAFSNWNLQTVWIASLFAGVLIGCCISYFLLRFFVKIPAKRAIPKSLLLSVVTLILAILMVDVPMIFHARSETLPYFFLGVVFNAVRFLFLGAAIGYFYEKLHASA